MLRVGAIGPVGSNLLPSIQPHLKESAIKKGVGS